VNTFDALAAAHSGVDAFLAMDHEMDQIHDPWINIYKVQELLFRFCGRRDQGISVPRQHKLDRSERLRKRGF